MAGGVTCVIARRLYSQHASGNLPGDWLDVDEFKDPQITKSSHRSLARRIWPVFVSNTTSWNSAAPKPPDSITVRVVERK